MNLKQIGAYFIDAAVVLGLFFKAGWAVTVTNLLNAIGLGLQTGSGTIGPITVPGLSTLSPYLLDVAVVLGIFHADWATTVASFLLALSAIVAAGGTSAPIRLGSEEATLTVQGDQLTINFSPRSVS
jgi:hypothetical protein